MIVNLCRVIEDEAPSAIGAIGFTRMTDRQVDHRMTEGTAAAIAPDSRRFHVNDLGWLHVSRSSVFSKRPQACFIAPPGLHISGPRGLIDHGKGG
jgi:hypothetical protein